MHEAAFLAPIIGGARGVIMARDALGPVIDLMDRSATSNLLLSALLSLMPRAVVRLLWR